MPRSKRLCTALRTPFTFSDTWSFLLRMIHKACGYRDLEYLELKLRHRSVMR